MGALALTGKASIRDPFGPFRIDVRFVPFGAADALRAAAGPECAAVFVEASQGEAGVIPPPAGYLQAAREACDASGAVLVLDEIQSGIGRTGDWFAHRCEGVTPMSHAGQGARRRAADRRVRRVGAFGSVLGKGAHGRRSARTRSPARPRWPCWTIEADGLLKMAATVGRSCRDGIAAIQHRCSAGYAARGCRWPRSWPVTRPPTWRRPRGGAGFLVDAVQPDAIRLRRH